jgi:L-2-hydroxyglutarate oxidase LhgO
MSHEAAEIEVPSTDIAAREGLVKALARIAAVQGANIVTHAKVRRLEPLRDRFGAVSEAEVLEG